MYSNLSSVIGATVQLHEVGQGLKSS